MTIVDNDGDGASGCSGDCDDADPSLNILDADGDGKLDTNDLLIYWKQLKDMLSHSLPSSSGFATGFAIGLYYL